MAEEKTGRDRKGGTGEGGVEKLSGAIMESAEAEKKSILEKAAADAAARRDQLRREAREESGAWLEAEKKSRRRAADRQLTAEKIAARRELLARRRKLLEEVIDRALARLDKDADFLASFYSKSVKNLPAGEYRLEASDGLKELLPADWWTSLEVPEKVKIDFSGFSTEIENGIVLSASRVEIRFSPARLLLVEKAEMEKRIAGILFAEPAEQD